MKFLRRSRPAGRVQLVAENDDRGLRGDEQNQGVRQIVRAEHAVSRDLEQFTKVRQDVRRSVDTQNRRRSGAGLWPGFRSMRVGNGLGFRFVWREDGPELGDPQHFVDLGGHGADGEGARRTLRSYEIAYEEPEGAAVDEVHLAEVQHEVAGARAQCIQRGLERGELFAGNEPSTARQDPDITYAAIG